MVTESLGLWDVWVAAIPLLVREGGGKLGHARREDMYWSSRVQLSGWLMVSTTPFIISNYCPQ